MARAVKYISYASRIHFRDDVRDKFAKWQGGEGIAKYQKCHFRKRREIGKFQTDVNYHFRKLL